MKPIMCEDCGVEMSEFEDPVTPNNARSYECSECGWTTEIYFEPKRGPKMATKKKLVVTKNEEAEVPFEVMQQAIVDIAESMRRLSETRVSRRLILALVKDNTGISKEVIGTVLDSLEHLERVYLKPRGARR
jgi:hypothetical protein